MKITDNRPNGFYGYRIYSAKEDRSYYFSIKNLGKTQAKKLAKEKVKEIEDKKPLLRQANIRKLPVDNLPAGLGIRVLFEEKVLKYGNKVWYCRPVFCSEVWSKKDKKIDMRYFSLNKHGYDNAWEMAVKDFCKRKNVLEMEERLVSLRPNKSMFMDLLFIKLEGHPEMEINIERFEEKLNKN